MPKRVMLSVLLCCAVAAVFGPTQVGAAPNAGDEYVGSAKTNDGATVHAGESSHVTPADPQRPTPVRVATGVGNGGPAHPVTCTWHVETMAGGSFFDLGDAVAIAIPEGYQVLRTCTDTTDGHVISSDWIAWPGRGGADLAAAPPVTAQEVARQAQADLVLPAPSLRAWPQPERFLVGLETWFHLDTWQPQTATADTGGVAATVTATPVRAVWHLHEATLTCTDAGRPFDPDHPDTTTDCGYTFAHYTGATITMSVDVVYHLTWTATTGETGDLGELARTTAFPARIWETQAVIN